MCKGKYNKETISQEDYIKYWSDTVLKSSVKEWKKKM